MHGVIFTAFDDFLTEHYGPDVARHVFGEEPRYLLSNSYEDERFTALVVRATAPTGVESGDLLEEFGVFAAQQTFSRLYPAFFAVSRNTHQFLLTVESRIHELVRATIPHAKPPELFVSELGADAVQIVYASPRKLCRLLRGLAEGTARHYGERTTIDEPECMLRGDRTCRFEIRLSPVSDGD